MNLPVLYILLALASAMSVPERSVLSDPIASPECQAWVDSVYNSLSERERVAQLMVPHISPSEGEASKALIRKLVGDYGVGGLLFTKADLGQYADMINYAQSVAKVPLIITLDGEWGLAMRLSDAPSYPRNRSLGAITDTDLLYDYGREVARQCRALGIQVNFAPVLDVNTNRENSVIGTRSYGEDPNRVSALGRAYSLGLEDGGVMAVGKHFPGHGSTSADSHKELPVATADRNTLEARDILPFRDYAKAQLGGIMVGHIGMHALDSTDTPASMSRIITQGYLKDKLGYQGLVFTDGLGMKGANVDGNVCVNALKAGADVLLSPRKPTDLDAVLKAIDDGEISNADIEERCRKLLAYKYILCRDSAAVAADASRVITPASLSLRQRLTDGMVTVTRNQDQLLPIADLAHKRIAVVSLGAPAENDFSEMCSRYAKVDKFGQESLGHLRDYDIVLAGVFADNEGARQAMRTLSHQANVVPVFFIDPYEVKDYAIAKAHAVLLAYENSPEAQRSAAKGLFGGIKVSGRLPMDVPGAGSMGAGVTLPKTRLGYSTLADAGFGPELSVKIDSIINDGLKQGAYPGCQIVVARNGDIIVDRSYGHTTKGGRPVDRYTLYDLASVSKTVGTLPGVMKAYDLGLFDLDAPASKHIPGLNVPGKDDVTPRMLLHHETGIQPSLNLFDIMMDPDTYEGRLWTTRYDNKHKIKIYNKMYGSQSARMRTDIVRHKPGDGYDAEIAKGMYASKETYDSIMGRIYNSRLRDSRAYCYSCLNFCLLMDLEQQVTHQPHQQWVTDSIWAPIGAYTFCYRPTEKFPVSRIAATENDTYLRRQHLQGYVHDELAAFSGGVQGNAGVFGTATDVAKLCQMWLNDGWYGDAVVLSPETSHLFTTEKSQTCHRGLGFDKPNLANPENSSTCDEAGAAVYGHTGYTGTCYWVDPDEDLIFVFLSNRVDPTRNNEAWSRCGVRPKLMSEIYKAIRASQPESEEEVVEN